MKKFFSVIASLSLLLDSFYAPAIAIAQEISPTPEPTSIVEEVITSEPISTGTPTIEQSVQLTEVPTPEPTPTETPIEIAMPSIESTAIPTTLSTIEPTATLTTETEPQVADPSAEITVFEKIYLTSDQTVVDSINSDWNIDQTNGFAVTKEKIKLGIKYIFPSENNVTITFKSLPANESLRSPIKIARVKTSELNLPNGMDSYGEYAYDITTNMVDGTFDYDLTLPKPDNQNVEIAYIEDQNSSPIVLGDDKTSQEGSVVKASSVDHFTIFVVINPTPSGALCIAAGATSGTGCYSTIQDAIDASVNGDTVEIQSDISVGQQVNINKDITINGNSYTVSPTFTKTDNSNNSVFGIYSPGVTISNLTIDGTLGTNLHGINTYMVTNILLDNLLISNNDRTGIVVNGSMVTVNNITTSGNGWHAINVDQGTGVTTEARLTIEGTSSHNETYHIFLDDIDKNVSVNDTNPKQYDYTHGTSPAVWGLYTLKSSGNASATLSQYANDAPVGWINGNLGASKATYYEGDSIPYRMVMDNLSLSSHSLTIEWDTTKNDKHAEDYLTSFNRTVGTANPCTGVIGCSTYTAFPIPIDPQVAGAGVTQIAGDFRLYGGTISSVSAYSYPDGTGFVGDNTARITINFTASVSNPVLAWGGHIAHRSDWGQNNSAIAISGSPYHMRLIDLDGSGGNQDRSLSADAVIFPATITITKVAAPNSEQDFIFTTTGTGLSGFTLDDNGNNSDGTSNTSVFSVTDFGAKTITESVVSTWSLTNLVCQVTGTGSQSTNLSTRTATLNVEEGDIFTCTYTNTLQNGTLRVNKVTIPNEAEVFSVTASGTGTITGSATQNVSGGSFVDYTVTTGTYSVVEAPKTGWAESNNTCVRVSVPAGGVGECTITNKKNGHIIVDKVTNPSGDPQSFTFMSTGTGYVGFSLTDSTTPNDQELVSGNYSVSETVPTEWNLTSTTCVSSIGDIETAGNLELDPGETINCTFTNTKQGKIIVEKETTPNGDSQVFNFVSSYNTNGFSLSDGQSNDSGFLTPGTYSVNENGIAGWTLSNSSCDDGSLIGAINLSAGEIVTCTFNNTKLGKIIIEKQTLPDGSSQVFQFIPSYGASFNLTDGQTNESVYLSPGTYSVTENSVAGWDTVASCDDQSLPGAINLSAGETVRCTFVNTQRGNISGYKFDSRYGDDDTGLTGILGWTIELYSCTTSAFTSCSVTPIVTTSTIAGGSYSFLNLIPGYYQVKEVLQNGWTNITSLFRNITLDSGETDRENNFVNFKLATIVVHKNVLDEFGNEIVDNQTFQVQKNGLDTQNISENSDVTYSDLVPGTYTISEVFPVPQGYEFVSMTNEGSVTVESGQTHNVYVVNKQLPGSITIVKDAQPNAAFNFGFTGDLGSFTLDDDANPTYSSTTTFSNLGAGTYSVTENPYTTWTLTNLVCVDPDQGTVVDIASRNAVIDLDFGENITCTYTNSRRPKINIIKHVINDNGGTNVAGDFTVNVTGENPSKTTFLGSESGTWVYFDPGSYSIDEIEQTGYTKSLSVNCSGTLSYGNSRTCTIINDDQPGTLIVKKIINGGSKAYEDFGFRVNGDKTTYFESDGQNNRTVDAGYYSVVEDAVDGYTTSYDNCTRVFVPNGGSQTCTITNTRDQGEIIIKKIIDEDGDLINTTDDQTLGIGWGIDVDGIAGDVDNPTAGSTDSSGEYKTGKIKTGFYDASETLQDGYDFVSSSCSDRSTVDNIDLGKDEVVTCTFYNTPNGTIHGYKWNDVNGNATDFLESEDKLGAWTINLFAWNDEDEGYTDLVKTTSTDSNVGPDFGWYWFTHLFPGTYKVCEENQVGWQQTYPGENGCHLVTIPDTNPSEFPEVANYVEESPTYNFGNMEDDPSIVITKSNDKSGGASINDEVTYTLIVTNTGNLNLSDLVIKDAFPGGFSYISGSSYLDGVLISDPNISGGLLTWDIGDLGKDKEVELTYKLKINDNVVRGGSYKNFATCSAIYGSLQQNELSESFRALFLTRNEIECNIADSSVTIGTSNGYGGNLNGQVLGASIELPATGNPTWLLALALLGLTTGLYLKKNKNSKNKSKISGFLVALLGLMVFVNPAMAITPTVSIQGLPSYINTNDFKLSCSALGGSNVQFSFKKEGGSYQDFGSLIDITSNPCQIQVTGSQVSEQTRYYFKVTLDGGVSEETNTFYDISGPSPVSGYYKDTIDSDDYKIHWKNPSDIDFDKVIIYRGETVDFSADNSHEIARVSGSPSSDMTYDEHTPDPNKTYFYALRAIDKVGNSSSLVGDGSTTTTTTTVTQTQPQNGVSEVRQLPKEATGQVLGEEDGEKLEVESTQAPTFTETVAKITSSKTWIFVGGALILLAIILFTYFKRKK